MAQTRDFTAVIQREGNGYVALCPELDVASQGDTVEEARSNLEEALELFLEVCRLRGGRTTASYGGLRNSAGNLSCLSLQEPD